MRPLMRPLMRRPMMRPLMSVKDRSVVQPSPDRGEVQTYVLSD